MTESSIFKLWGNSMIEVIIHKSDVESITPLECNGSVIYLKNKVPYQVSGSVQEVRQRLNLLSA